MISSWFNLNRLCNGALKSDFFCAVIHSQCPLKVLCRRPSTIFTFSSNMKTSHSLVSQHSFKHASADETSSSLRNFAPIAFDSSVRMIVDEWMSNRSAIDE